jgi:hypothetical protein
VSAPGEERSTSAGTADAGGRTAPAVGAAERRGIVWDETGRPRVLAEGGRVPRGRRSRFRLAAVGLVGLLVVGAVAWFAGGAERVAPDVFAVDQVAQRYRALGADLLAGAQRCAPLPPSPGQTERLGCTVDTAGGPLTLELTSFDTAVRLREVRAQALPAAAGSVRSARATRPDAAFVMDETGAGASRVYWDVEAPRPVSASVAADRPLGELVAFYDARRSAAVPRPEQPGAAFTVPSMWRLARTPVSSQEGVECARVPPAPEYPGAVQQVTCRFPNGMVADFGLMPDVASFNRLRVALSSPPGIAAGSQWTGGWQSDEFGEQAIGQMAYYTLAEGNVSRLYYDSREWLCFGVLHGDGFSREQLHSFWEIG